MLSSALGRNLDDDVSKLFEDGLNGGNWFAFANKLKDSKPADKKVSVQKDNAALNDGTSTGENTVLAFFKRAWRSIISSISRLISWRSSKLKVVSAQGLNNGAQEGVGESGNSGRNPNIRTLSVRRILFRIEGQAQNNGQSSKSQFMGDNESKPTQLATGVSKTEERSESATSNDVPTSSMIMVCGR